MPVYGSGSASGPQKPPKKKRKVKRRRTGVLTDAERRAASRPTGGKMSKADRRRGKTTPEGVARFQRELARADRQRTRPSYRPPPAVTVDKEGRAKIEAGSLAGKATRDPLVRALRNAPKTPSDATAILEAASLLPPVRAARAVGTAAKIIKSVNRASTPKVTRLGNKARTAERAGKVRVAKRARKGEARAAERAESRARKRQRKLDRTIRGEGGAKAGAKRTWKKRQPAALTKAGRKVKARQYAAGASVVGAGAPAVALGPGADYVATSAKATAEDPVAVAKTTARTAKALPSAVAGDAIDIAKYLAGDEEAGKRALDSYKLYLDSVQRVASGDTEAVKEEVGLVPLAAGGLGALSVFKGMGGAVRPSSPLHTRKVRRLRNRAETAGTAKKREAARDKLDEIEAPRGERRRQRRTEGREHDVTQRNLELQAAEDLRTSGRGRKSIGRRVVRLEKSPVTKDVSEAALIQFLGREGLYDMKPDAALREVKRRREALREPSKEVPGDSTATRKILDAILANPAVLRSRELREVNVKGFGPADRQFSIERHSERTGKRETTPDPRDVRARYQHLRRAEGIPDEGERIVPALRGKTKVRPRVGQDVNRELRREATDDIKRAAVLRRKARQEEARAQGTRKELNVRRVADDRRTATRARNKKLRNLEKRREAWAAKVSKAKTSDTRKRYAAKVADLDKQIKFTKARLEMMASPVRLRTVSRASKHRVRARELREQAELLDLEARARLAIINRAKRADALERRAIRIEKGAAKKVRADENPKAMRAEAVRLRREVQADIETLRQEADVETRAVIGEKGYSEPIFFPESKVDDQGKLNVAYGGEYLGSNIPSKEKYRTGTLAEEGRINESSAALMDNFFRRRVSLEMRRHVSEALERNNFDPGDGKGTVRTGAEWRKLMRDDKIPEGMDLFPAQEWDRVLQSGKWDDAQELLDRGLMTDARLAKMEDGRMYALWPREAKREFRAQMDQVTTFQKRARYASRIQSGLMLGTSPLWFEFQLLASPMALVYRHHNPARWAKEASKIVTDWRKIPRRDRLRWQAEFGGTSAHVFDMRDIRAGVRPETVQTADSVMRVAMKSPAGRVLNHFARGGPLIAGNRAFEGSVRTFASMLEMDKAINKSRATQAVQSIARANDATQKMLSALKGKSKQEQIEFLLSKEGRAAKREVVDGVNDGLGDWTSLTSKERGAAALAVFYPFMRFSLKWATIVAPRDNPLLFALVLNASQQNAQELDKMGKGETSVFDLGNVVIHGEQNQLLDLGRVSPAGGAIAEALAEGELNLATLTRMTWPALGVPLTSLAGVDPLSGEPTDRSLGEGLARGAIGTSPISRTQLPNIYPRSDVSQAGANIEGRDDRGFLEQLFIPDMLNEASEFKRSSRLFNTLDKSSSPDYGDFIPRVTENPKRVRKIAKRYVERASAASANRDKLAKLMEDAGVDTREDAKAIDKFFSLVATIRAKRLHRGSGSSYGSSSSSGSSYGGGSSGGSSYGG